MTEEKMNTCENCGAATDNEEMFDPYHEELTGEQVLVLLCTDCYNQACDDI